MFIVVIYNISVVILIIDIVCHIIDIADGPCSLSDSVVLIERVIKVCSLSVFCQTCIKRVGVEI